MNDDVTFPDFGDVVEAQSVRSDAPTRIGVKYHTDVAQGSEEWLAARRGLLTASEMKHIITPGLKIADNDKSRAHVNELLAQRITGYVEPHYISEDMLRGQDDEIEARILYSKHYAPVTECGFITNDQWGFTIGFSPDGLVGDDGFIECKSRRQKFQVASIIDDAMDADYMIQVQTGFLVTGRKWCDHITYSGGLPMLTVRVLPDHAVMAAIETAARSFEAKLAERLAKYNSRIMAMTRLIPTERRIVQEIFA